MLRTLWVLSVFCLLCAKSASAQHQESNLIGLSLTLDAGVVVPDKYHANFYNGQPSNVNNLTRILNSEAYGPTIWTHLTDQNLIGSSIANYHQLTVAEYGKMYYRTALRYGVGLRYDFERHPWGWMAHFDYSKLNAVGVVLLNSGHNTSILSNVNAYVNCPIAGSEKRIFFDLGLFRKFPLRNGLSIEAALGGNINNTSVVSNDIMIGNLTYSILDVWDGEMPGATSYPYEYINQGGIGYGGFASLSFGITLPSHTALQVCYNFCYTQINLDGYEQFASHHTVSLVVALNNFSFFDTKGA